MDALDESRSEILRDRLAADKNTCAPTQTGFTMPFVHITWLPKTCRTAATRKEIADAVLKAIINVKSADVSPQNLVVRFSEAVDGFPLPQGHSENPALQAPQKKEGEAFLKDR